jgi:hypothetical protein
VPAAAARVSVHITCKAAGCHLWVVCSRYPNISAAAVFADHSALMVEPSYLTPVLQLALQAGKSHVCTVCACGWATSFVAVLLRPRCICACACRCAPDMCLCAALLHDTAAGQLRHMGMSYAVLALCSVTFIGGLTFSSVWFQVTTVHVGHVHL